MFQPFDFKDVDDFLSALPEVEFEIVEMLRNLVFECLPDCIEKLSYNVPFYSINRRICFIWPATVPWGKKPRKGVEFGFCEGHLLQDDLSYLERGNRKQVFNKVFNSLEDIDENMLRNYLLEAYEVDLQFAKNIKF